MGFLLLVGRVSGCRVAVPADFFFSIEVSVRVWGYEFGLCSVWGRTGEGDGQMVAAFFFSSSLFGLRVTW